MSATGKRPDGAAAADRQADRVTTAPVRPGPVTWGTPLGELPRMTPARVRALEEAGFTAVHDLLRHYPRRHEDRREFPAFPKEATGLPVCLRGTVVETKTARFGRRMLFNLSLREVSGDRIVRCRWFNLRYLPRILQAGQDLVIHGRAKALKKGGLIFEHPDFEILEADVPESNLIHLDRITPIHPAIGPWSARQLRRLIYEILRQVNLSEAPHLWPVGLSVETAPSTGEALRQLHFPDSWETLESARLRLAREELFEMQCVLARQRQRQISTAAPAVPKSGELLRRFVKSLPFDLTKAQKRVLGEIFADLGSGRPMNRLLHGDVGSGKTVVAATAMLGAFASGHSAALMAPTQVLAHQHYENLRRLLDPLGVPVALRTAARREKRAADGPRVIVGTHALLFAPEDVGRPALVVVDEQHKFGVRQRARLAAGDPHPHVLVMSATPIPRTLALTLYGDLDISLLDEVPPGRTPVTTMVRPHAKLGDAAAFIRRQLDEGRQAYLVYPVIEEGKRADLKAVTAEHARWADLLAPHACALLHGRMAAEEKEQVMGRFRTGEVRALVTTTVIEVGVDVANATVLLVENAERFGLAQLHQLRGRVGRGAAKSWCILLAGEEAGDKLERLRILEQAADGFAIAEADLAQRGPGDLLGTDQTGLPPIRLARLPRDFALLEEARQAARDLMAKDPGLAAHPVLRSRVAAWEKRFFAGVA